MYNLVQINYVITLKNSIFCAEFCGGELVLCYYSFCNIIILAIYSMYIVIKCSRFEQFIKITLSVFQKNGLEVEMLLRIFVRILRYD